MFNNPSTPNHCLFAAPNKHKINDVALTIGITSSRLSVVCLNRFQQNACAILLHHQRSCQVQLQISALCVFHAHESDSGSNHATYEYPQRHVQRLVLSSRFGILEYGNTAATAGSNWIDCPLKLFRLVPNFFTRKLLLYLAWVCLSKRSGALGFP